MISGEAAAFIVRNTGSATQNNRSVIVHDPNLMRLAIDPLEDDAPLIVHSNRIKVLQVAS
jgi:hypothetical protein